MGAIRPDIIAETATGKLMIEIAVSHFVDNKKQSLIEERGIAALEIFIDPIDFSEWSWGSLTQSVLDDRYNRIWIYHPAVHALKAVAEQKAKISAESESLPQWRPPPKKLILFLWGHKIHITDYSWGFTLWYQYDNDIYRVIKDIAKIHGGRWTPQYRNWTFAPGVRMKVEDELRDVGACR